MVALKKSLWTWRCKSPLRDGRLSLFFGLTVLLSNIGQSHAQLPEGSTFLHLTTGLKYVGRDDENISIVPFGKFSFCSPDSRILSKIVVQTISNAGFINLSPAADYNKERTCLTLEPTAFEMKCKKDDANCLSNAPVYTVTLFFPKNERLNFSRTVILPGGTDPNGCGRTFSNSQELCLQPGQLVERAVISTPNATASFSRPTANRNCGSLTVSVQEPTSYVYADPLRPTYLCTPGNVAVTGDLILSNPGPLYLLIDKQ